MSITSSTYVLSLGTLGWSEFSEMDIKSVQTLSGAKRADNINLILENDGDIVKYPSLLSYTEKDSWFKTKKFPLKRNTKIRKIYLEFETFLHTDIVTVTLRVYNIKFLGGYKEIVIINLESGKWRGLDSGLKGDYLEIKVENTMKMKKMKLGLREIVD